MKVNGLNITAVSRVSYFKWELQKSSPVLNSLGMCGNVAKCSSLSNKFQDWRNRLNRPLGLKFSKVYRQGQSPTAIEKTTGDHISEYQTNHKEDLDIFNFENRVGSQPHG